MIAQLKKDIEDKYGSIYAFCKQHPDVKRATAYLVLNGQYPGRIHKQAEILREKLMGDTDAVTKSARIEQDDVLEVLIGHKCANCRQLRKNCAACRQKTASEAEAVFLYVSKKL